MPDVGQVHLAAVPPPPPKVLLHVRHCGAGLRQLRARPRGQGHDADEAEEERAEGGLRRVAEPAVHGARGREVDELHREPRVQGEGSARLSSVYAPHTHAAPAQVIELVVSRLPSMILQGHPGKKLIVDYQVRL